MSQSYDNVYHESPENLTRQLSLAMKNTDFLKKFDYVMVFPLNKDKTQTPHCKFCIDHMLEADFQLYTYLSVQEDKLFVLITVPISILEKFADIIQYVLLLDETVVRERIEAGNVEKRIAPRKINEELDITTLRPYQYIYCKYELEDPDLYAKDSVEGVILTEMIRLRLIYYLLQAPRRQGGCDIKIRQYLHHQHILAFYPLHEEKGITLTDDLLSASTLSWNQPIERIRSYFGEDIALFNAFSSHFAMYLIVPAIVGIALQIVVWIQGNFSSPVLPFFGIIMAIWSIVFIESWKRKEIYLALQWGQMHFETLEVERPEFHGMEIKSYVNGNDIIYFPPSSLYFRVLGAASCIGVFICLVLGVLTGIYYLRYQLQPHYRNNASIIASVLNIIQITIFNYFYELAARWLTDFENKRTETEYRNAFIVKIFIFQFINSYSSFFFLAFVAPFIPNNIPGSPYPGECGANSCMEPLSINLGIIFGTRLIVKPIVELFSNRFFHWMRLRENTKIPGTKYNEMNLKDVLTPPEKEFAMLPYDSVYESILTYADVAIQFGYMTLFATALPISCVFTLVSVYINLRVKSYSRIKYYQRPIPLGARSIGIWETIFSILAFGSVLTNAGIIVYTMNVLDTEQYTYTGKNWIFIGFQWTLLCLQFILLKLIPDIPLPVQIQMARAEFINEKLIFFADDEDYDEIMKDLDNPVKNKEKLTKLHSMIISHYGSKSDFMVFKYPTLTENPDPMQRNSINNSSNIERNL